MLKKKYYVKEFWKNLKSISYYKLLLTIFLIFSEIGFASDIFQGFKQSYGFLALNVLFSGFLGTMYAHSFIKQRKLIPVTLLIHILYSVNVSDFTKNSTLQTVPHEKYIVFGIALIITIILAYIFLMNFITTEGIPQIKLRAEMDLAKEMHKALVPEIKIETNKFLIYGKSIPIDEVGGDLVDVCFKDEEMLCYIADVSGHGISSGLFMGMFKSSVHTILMKDFTVEGIFNDSNKSLYSLKKQNIFLTAAAIIFKQNNILEYSVAGHLPILYFDSSKNELKKLLNKQIAISVKHDFNYTGEKFNYQSGDIFILLSDGLTEVFNVNKIGYGLEKFINVIEKNISRSPDELYSILLKNVNEYGNQIDDQSLLIIKCK